MKPDQKAQTSSTDAFAGRFQYRCFYQNGWSGHKESLLVLNKISALLRSPERALVNAMEIYEIRPTGEGKRCVLSGPLGIVESMEIDTIREAALHTQFCAGTREAILRTFNLDGTLRDERAIPERTVISMHGAPIKPTTYF